MSTRFTPFVVANIVVLNTIIVAPEKEYTVASIAAEKCDASWDAALMTSIQ